MFGLIQNPIARMIALVISLRMLRHFSRLVCRGLYLVFRVGNAAVLPVGFSTPTNIEPFQSPGAAAIAGDVTGDGIPDIVFLGQGPTAVVYQQISNRLFRPFSTNDVSGLGLTATALADANNDGVLDLFSVDYGNNGFHCYTNNGGHFTLSQYVNTGSGASGIAFLDANKDGKLDFALSILYGMRVNIYLGDGLGHFGLSSQHDIGTTPTSIASADLDGDGYMDLVTVNSEMARSISILYGGPFVTFSPAINYPIPAYGVSIAIKDLDGDGRPDIVVGADLGIVVLLSGPNRTIVQSNYYPVINLSSIGNIVLADLNNDGFVDIVARSEYLLGVGNGMFANSQASGIVFSYVIDLDMDGRKDLVGAVYGSEYFSIAYNTTMPRLSVIRDPSGLRFGWPNALGTNFQLQIAADNFGTNGWSDFQPTLSINSNGLSFLIPATNAKSFFRLKSIR